VKTLANHSELFRPFIGWYSSCRAPEAGTSEQAFLAEVDQGIILWERAANEPRLQATP